MYDDDDNLMYAASALYFICYAPIVYADWKNKNANIYNLPERLVSLVATTLAFVYAVRIQNVSLLTNYGPHLVMETLTLVFKLYYVSKNRWGFHRVHQEQKEDLPIAHTMNEFDPVI